MTARIPGFVGKSHVSLGKKTFVAGALLSFMIPQDIVAKEFHIVVNGHMACTFAGTKPEVNPLGILHGLFSDVYLSRRGTDRVKSFRGTRHMRNTQERQFGQMDGDLYKVNATDLAGAISQGNVAWGTTGQNTAFRSTVTMMMENKLSGAWYPSLFSTAGLQTATLNINCGQYSAVQDPANTDVNTYTGTIEIEVFASCCDAMLGSDQIVGDFNQDIEEKEYSGAQSNSRQFINPKGILMGMWVTGLQAGGAPFDFKHMKNSRLEVKYEGITLAEGSLSDYLELDASKTLLTSRLKGSAYLNFLSNRNPLSGLRIANGKQLEIIVTTDSTLSYATPVKLVFEYDQFIEFPGRSIEQAVA